MDRIIERLDNLLGQMSPMFFFIVCLVIAALLASSIASRGEPIDTDDLSQKPSAANHPNLVIVSRAITLFATMVISTIIWIYLNNLYDSIVTSKVATGNMIVSYILGGFIARELIGIGPIAGMIWSSDRVSPAILKRWGHLLSDKR